MLFENFTTLSAPPLDMAFQATRLERFTVTLCSRSSKDSMLKSKRDKSPDNIKQKEEILLTIKLNCISSALDQVLTSLKWNGPKKKKWKEMSLINWLILIKSSKAIKKINGLLLAPIILSNPSSNSIRKEKLWHKKKPKPLKKWPSLIKFSINQLLFLVLEITIQEYFIFYSIRFVQRQKHRIAKWTRSLRIGGRFTVRRIRKSLRNHRIWQLTLHSQHMSCLSQYQRERVRRA